MVLMQFLPDSLWLQAGLGVGLLLALQWVRLRVMTGSAEDATDTLGDQGQTAIIGSISATRAAIVSVIAILVAISGEGVQLLAEAGPLLADVAVGISNVLAIGLAVFAGEIGITQSQYIGIAFGIMAVAVLIRETND